jgi:hypothetical protein
VLDEHCDSRCALSGFVCVCYSLYQRVLDVKRYEQRGMQCWMITATAGVRVHCASVLQHMCTLLQQAVHSYHLAPLILHHPAVLVCRRASLVLGISKSHVVAGAAGTHSTAGYFKIACCSRCCRHTAEHPCIALRWSLYAVCLQAYCAPCCLHSLVPQ